MPPAASLFYKHPHLQVYCQPDQGPPPFAGLSACSPHAPTTFVLLGNATRAEISQPTLALQMYNQTTDGGPSSLPTSKLFFDLQVWPCLQELKHFITMQVVERELPCHCQHFVSTSLLSQQNVCFGAEWHHLPRYWCESVLHQQEAPKPCLHHKHFVPWWYKHC